MVVRWWSVVVRWHPLGRCWRPRMNRLLAQRGKAPCRCPRLRSRRGSGRRGVRRRAARPGGRWATGDRLNGFGLLANAFPPQARGVRYTSPDRNAHSFRTPQNAEQQPFNLPNPESAGKISYRSSLSRNSHCWERGCKRADQSPKKIPTNKIFLPQIPGLGTKVFQPFNSPLLHGRGPAARGAGRMTLPLSPQKITK